MVRNGIGYTLSPKLDMRHRRLIPLSQVRPHLAFEEWRTRRGAGGGACERLCTIRPHAGRCSSTPRVTSDCRHAFAGIVTADNIPVARRVIARGEPEHGLEREVPVEAPIVSKDKLVEVGVDVLAAQSMIGTEPQRFI